MYRFATEAGVIATVTAPVWVRKQENGYLSLCEEAQADGVRLHGVVYALGDRVSALEGGFPSAVVWRVPEDTAQEEVAAKMGHYVGNGSYGEDAPTAFYVKENAEMLVIQDGGTGETHAVFPEANQMKDGSGETLCQVAVEGTAVKLWSEESAEKQFNRAGVLYHYYSV